MAPTPVRGAVSQARSQRRYRGSRGGGDGNDRRNCWELFFPEATFPSADKGLLQSLQDTARFFPCIFILTELKNSKG